MFILYQTKLFDTFHTVRGVFRTLSSKTSGNHDTFYDFCNSTKKL